MVHPARIRPANDAPVRPGGRYVLYWMTAARRSRHNPALERAVALCAELGRPLLVFEGLRSVYPHASPRFQAFVAEGMADNAAAFAARGVSYIPWLESDPAQGGRVFAELAAGAALIVADDAPVFFLPRMVAAAAARAGVRMEAVDGWGLLPVSSPGRAYGRAVDFRRHLQRALGPFLEAMPLADPLAAYAAGPATSPVAPRQERAALLPGGVGPVALRGGEIAARAALAAFAPRLARYGAERSHPDADAASGLSPYLHWGHISAFEVFETLAAGAFPVPAAGSREGGWGGHPAESFLDQLVTWRELCANTAHFLPDYTGFASLPAWALATLDKHRADARTTYTLTELDEARTDDPVWNAAQRQLREEGTIQNYLRMLWGKRVLGWSATPEEAWERLVWLNNRWAIDGRDPNSWGGIAWVFGRYDRPWAPERPVLGSLRFMTSASAVRKLRMRAWLQRWSKV